MTPVWLDHALVVVLAVLFPIRASTFGYRRLAVAPPEQVAGVRRALYAQAIAIQWTLAAIVLTLWWWRGRSWAALGVVPRDLVGPLLGLAGVGVVALGLFKIRERARDKLETLARYRERLDHLERMLPHTPDELAFFHRVSWTAGFCEELLYRGYLMWYLGHWMGAPAAVLVSSALFGIGHAYQGWKGIVTTGLVGVVMALVYLAGSLWPAMVLHALVDIHSGTLAYAALVAPRPAAIETPDSGSGGAEART